MTKLMLFDLIGAILTFLAILLYHLYLIFFIKNKRGPTFISISNNIRNQWVEHVMQEEKDILAVQTLRNWTMAATFLASTSILISLGAINFLFSYVQTHNIAQFSFLINNPVAALIFLKIILLTIGFFLIFLCFSLAIRSYNHAAIIITLPLNKNGINEICVSNVVNKGACYYTAGMRGYYIIIPLCLWLFSTSLFIISSLILIKLLHGLDFKSSFICIK